MKKYLPIKVTEKHKSKISQAQERPLLLVDESNESLEARVKLFNAGIDVEVFGAEPPTPAPMLFPPINSSCIRRRYVGLEGVERFIEDEAGA